MTTLLWDQVGERVFETGVDRGVLYIPDDSGDYSDGFAWSGLTSVTESPSGADATPTYADNLKYLNLVGIEQFGGTIQAYTYPDEFGQCDGTKEPSAGVAVHQQSRKTFGFCYRTRIGNDVEGDSLGFKLHLVYGALAAPSERAYGTVNETPAAIEFSWTFTTTPVNVTGWKPTALLTIDSTTVDAGVLSDLEDILYGTSGSDARLPLPDEVLALFAAVSVTEVDLNNANAPTYNAGTHVVTLPAVTGVQWKVNGVNKANGAQPALTVGQVATITPSLAAGYVLKSTSDDTWVYEY